MNTLAEEFLADMGEEVPAEKKEDTGMNHDAEDEADEENEPEESMEIENLKEKYSSARLISRLAGSSQLTSLIEKISKLPAKRDDIGQLEHDPEYQLLVEASGITVEISQEILKIHRFIKEYYNKQFPELENTIYNPMDYARVVLKIKTQTDLNKVDLSDILPPNAIMVIRLTPPSSTKYILTPEEMAKVEEGCYLLLSLDDARKKIVAFVESRMSSVAPNLTALLGSGVAAKIITAAGGLTNLSKMPSSNVEAMGATKKALTGFSAAMTRAPQGYMGESEFIQKAPAHMKRKAGRLLVGKIVIAARVDQFREDPSGNMGRKLLEEIEVKIEKALEPPPAKLPKPLPAPDDKPRKRRGGKRMRKIKQRYEMTDLRKQANRVSFGPQAQEEVGLSGKTLGMLGVSGGGKVRLSAQDKGIIKKNSKKWGSSGATSGLSSSLAFTPVQGLELVNPAAAAAAAQKIKEANDKYFGTASTFARLK